MELVDLGGPKDGKLASLAGPFRPPARAGIPSHKRGFSGDPGWWNYVGKESKDCSIAIPGDIARYAYYVTHLPN